MAKRAGPRRMFRKPSRRLTQRPADVLNRGDIVRLVRDAEAASAGAIPAAQGAVVTLSAEDGAIWRSTAASALA